MTKALVLLCGGLSTRMGCDKAFLPFGASSLLNYQVARFRPYFEKIYVSVPAHAERPIDYTAHCGCPAIEDLYANIGPMGGLASCLTTLSEEILFFTSVDAPFTDPRLARTLCERLEYACAQGNGFQICALKNHADRIQPLFAAYTRDCLPDILRLIKEKNYRLRQLFHDHEPLIFDAFCPPEQFFNMNDPMAYYYALQRLSEQMPAAFPPDFPGKTPRKDIPVLSFTAKSGTGKTTYLEKLLPLLCRRQLRVAVIKHDAHGFQIDKPGKDSYRLTQAGAAHMILTSENQTAAIFTHPGQNPDLNRLLARVENTDLILTEGYKLGSTPKIHLLRKGYSETPVGNLQNTVAYVADFPYPADVPVFDLNKPEQILPFLLEFIRK